MSALSREIAIGVTTQQLISSLLQLKDQKADLAFACWRNPGEAHTSILISDKVREQFAVLESLKSGFIIKGFDQDATSQYLQATVLIKLVDDKPHIDIVEDTALLQSILNLAAEMNEQPAATSVHSTHENHDHDYLKLVKASVEHIRAGKFEKVVPSRTEKFSVSNFNAAHLFGKLCNSYPNAFISATYTPATGFWMGATPELLIKTSGDIFKTVALAGTQQYNAASSLSEVAWTQKEIEEQALVSRYIINCFKQIRLREFEEHGPKTVKAGNLIHLKTDFEVNMAATNFPELGSTMLNLLHPTSAVCGMPLDATYRFLNDNEHYQRELFSGYLGPVNIENTTAMYVNLRCMKIINQHTLQLYAGAGVTEDSIAEKELAETKHKMATLLSVIES